MGFTKQNKKVMTLCQKTPIDMSKPANDQQCDQEYRFSFCVLVLYGCLITLLRHQEIES